MTAEVGVVICAHTTERIDQLHRAVDSVQAQVPAPAELVLVIDHNAALQTYARLAFPAVRVVASTRSAGLSGARNEGLERVTQPIVAFLDDDAEAREGWLAALASPFADPQVHAVGGRAIPRWSTRRPTWFPPTFDWVVGCSHQGVPERPGPTRNVIGCSMAFRRDSLKAVGGFDGAVGRTATALLGAEETQACILLGQRFGAGSVWFEPAAVVSHHVAADREQLRYFLRRCLAEGRSKARVAARVGAAAGLSEERRHATRRLPAAMARGFLPGASDGDTPRRSLAVVAGLAATVAGFLLEQRVVGRAHAEATT